MISSDTEEEMLLKWRSFLHACDADILTGYNVQVRREFTRIISLSLCNRVNH